MALVDLSQIRMVKVVQRLYRKTVYDVHDAVTEALHALGVHRKVKRKRIAITAGSRGIARIAEVLRAVVSFVNRYGGEPFLFTAMGSHGGATPAGQLAVLESLGITEQFVGAPILATMDVEEIGTVHGAPVFVDKHSAHADGIIVVNRIKHHPDIYHGLGSGLMKMMAVGMGKRAGAEVVHRDGVRSMLELIPPIAQYISQKMNIIGCLALIENGYHELARIVPVKVRALKASEHQLLAFWNRVRPRLPFDDVDVLVVERMGKDIMGTGMDTFVIGRMLVAGEPEPKKPYVRAVVALDLTEKSHGNATGIGMCNAVTRRLIDKVDWNVTRINATTSGFIDRFKVPPILPNDYTAISFPLMAIKRYRPQDVRLVRIRDTLTLGCFYVSEALIPEVLANKRLRAVGEAQQLAFDEDGNLMPVNYE